MRRIAFLGAVAVLLVVVLAGLALAAHPHSPAPAPAPALARHAARRVAARVRQAPPASAVMGSTCYVGVPDCSQTPCLQFVAGGQSAVYVLPGPARPAVSCQARARARANQALTAPPPGVVAPPALGAVLQATLPRLAHRLSSRGP